MTNEKISNKINNAQVKIDSEISLLLQYNKHDQDPEIAEIIQELQEAAKELRIAHQQITIFEQHINKENDIDKDIYWEYIERKERGIGLSRSEEIIGSGRSSGALKPILDSLKHEKYPHSLFETGLRIIPQEVLDAPLVKRIVWIKAHEEYQLWLWET